MKTSHLLIVSALTLTQFFSSCKKEIVEPPKNVTTQASVETIANDKAYLNSVYYKTLLVAFGAGMGDINMFKNDEASDILAGCATVTTDTTVFPYQVTINFGTSGCTLSDGTPVTGVIYGTYTNRNLGTSGSTATLDMSNFYINGNQVLGTFSVHNKGAFGGGNYFFDLSVGGGELKYGSDGRLVKQDVTWLVEWQANGTATKEDDFFAFTGTASGITSNGDSYTETIAEPLLMSRATGCVRQFVSGQTVATISGQPDLTINYGDGTCDTRADAVQNGVSVRINLQNF
ncbi:MAG TPA: hypothetical protein VK154_17795 [Chitinophagales bacterium]|nr:hypothetical protein [Chitinophagales bacterium]